jgi:hypothetical protein
MGNILYLVFVFIVVLIVIVLHCASTEVLFCETSISTGKERS